MHDDHDFNRDITDAEREFDRLVESGEIIPAAVALRKAAADVMKLGAAQHTIRLQRVEQSRRIGPRVAQYVNSEGAEHVVLATASGWTYFVVRNANFPHPECLVAREKGGDVSTLADGAAWFFNVCMLLVEREAPDIASALRAVEARGGTQRELLLNLTARALTVQLRLPSGDFCKVWTFSNRPRDNVAQFPVRG